MALLRAFLAVLGCMPQVAGGSGDPLLLSPKSVFVLGSAFCFYSRDYDFSKNFNPRGFIVGPEAFFFKPPEPKPLLGVRG